MSEETKAKISLAMKGRPPHNKGKHPTAETLAKMSESSKGRHHTEETKAIIGMASRGRHPTEETRMKLREAQGGNKHPNWKGGKLKNAEGYILIHMPNHPNSNSRGYVLEHRMIMEGYLGRPLLPTEVVHHINGIRDDNRIENFMLFSSKGKHMNLHKKEHKIMANPTGSQKEK